MTMWARSSNLNETHLPNADDPASLLRRLRQAEQDGAEIAMRAESAIHKLRKENEELKQSAKYHDTNVCIGCFRKSLVLALLAGYPLSHFWFVWLGFEHSGVRLHLMGLLFAFGPLLWLIGRHYWNLYK